MTMIPWETMIEEVRDGDRLRVILLTRDETDQARPYITDP